jgi:hypothetical protein
MSSNAQRQKYNINPAWRSGIRRKQGERFVQGAFGMTQSSKTRPRNWQPMARATFRQKTAAEKRDMIKHIRTTFPDITEAEAARAITEASSELGEVWMNDRYQCHVIRHPGGVRGPNDDCGIIQLSIKRLDRTAVHDWRDLQRIKNEVVGQSYEAVELYPAEDRLVDTANQYHLWIVNDPMFRWPIGYMTPRVVTSDSGGGAVQRPMEEPS